MGTGFARLYDTLMAPLEHTGLRNVRRPLIRGAHGVVLEMGSGTGLNFPYPLTDNHQRGAPPYDVPTLWSNPPPMTDATRRATRLDLNRLPADPSWPTQRQDLQAAVAILQRHAAQGEPLRLLADWGETADGERI